VIEKHTGSQTAALAANIARVHASIADAAQRVGRNPEEITLVAVSKTKPIELIEAAFSLGITTFGENKVQEAQQKIATFHPTGIRWHMIGHLQSNKAGKASGLFDCIHSIDSWHLAQILNQHAEKNSTIQPILLQVNISGETSKEGLQAEETVEIARRIVSLQHLEVQGLMTVAPLVEKPEDTRPIFRALRILRDTLRQEIPQCPWQQLSMGMTDDYHIAIEEGATIVRIGRAIFGERTYKGNVL
jgi:PLP dependent protein